MRLGGGEEITGQERGAGVKIPVVGRGDAQSEGVFPGSGARKPGPDSGSSSRGPGRTSKRPGLGRRIPGRAGKNSRSDSQPQHSSFSLPLPKTRVNSRQESPDPPGPVNRTSRGAAARTAHWLRSMRSALATPGRGRA